VFPADPEAHTIRVTVIVGSGKNPRDWRGSLVPRSQGKTYRFGGVIFAMGDFDICRSRIAN
jgi:hypothetical protein